MGSKEKMSQPEKGDVSSTTNPSLSRDVTSDDEYDDWEQKEATKEDLTNYIELPVLPCWDETDDGLPPFCRNPPGTDVAWWKVFHPRNRYTNDNLIMLAFGNVGFGYFDKERKFFMGLAMWSTLLSIAFTVAGCFALSVDSTTVINTNWAYVEQTNDATGETSLIYVGLRSLVYVSQPCTTKGCTETSFRYATDATNVWPNAFVKNGLDKCRMTAYGSAFGAFTTCFTLISPSWAP